MNRHHRLGHVLGNEFSSSVFLGAEPLDLANHDDAFGLRIVLEQLQAVDEAQAIDRVTADADDRCSGPGLRVVKSWNTAS